jgi:hypothetical protein
MKNQNTDWTLLTMLTTVMTIIVSVSWPSFAISLAHQGESDKIMDKQLSEARGQIAKFQEKTNYPDLKLYSGKDPEKREWIHFIYPKDCGNLPPLPLCPDDKPKPEPSPKPDPRRKETSDKNRIQ